MRKVLVQFVFAVATIFPCFVRCNSNADTNRFTLHEHRLFEVTTCNSDGSFVNRPTPCLALIGDTTLVFSTFKDTLAFIDLNGNVKKKVHHRLGYPTYLHFNSDRKLLYFLNTGIKGDRKRAYIYSLSESGEVVDSVRYRGNIRQWWTFSGAILDSIMSSIEIALRARELDGWRVGVHILPLTDILILWRGNLLMGRRNPDNWQTYVSTESGVAHYEIDFMPRSPYDDGCAFSNDLERNAYNMRLGLCTGSRGELLYSVLHHHQGFRFSTLSLGR